MFTILIIVFQFLITADEVYRCVSEECLHKLAPNRKKSRACFIKCNHFTQLPLISSMNRAETHLQDGRSSTAQN